ncbi:MAG: thioredoxin family protein [Nanoarchaeota archaeon]|nr:thioredoxin family protein [Nanoarchaeota archaeon]
MKKTNDLITVFTMPTCPNCPKVKAMCEEVAKEIGMNFRVVDIKSDLFEGLMYQVMETPSIALNDETLFFGEAPTKAQLVKELKLHVK